MMSIYRESTAKRWQMEQGKLTWLHTTVGHKIDLPPNNQPTIAIRAENDMGK